MSNEMFSKKNQGFAIAIILGTVAGLISMRLCVYFNLAIFGFNIYLIISPIIAGFVETYISKKLTHKTSGAISAIFLFVITNAFGWIFTPNPIKWNIFTFGGLALMFQAAFPLTINYIILAIGFSFVYIFGRIGAIFETILVKHEKTVPVSELPEERLDNLLILTNAPDIPILEYHGLVFAENVIEFEQKNASEKVEYLGSHQDKKSVLKHQDYVLAKKYILNQLELNAKKLGANAIIDIEIEYTNYNQQIPPDMLIAAYGTAVTIENKYVSCKE